MIIRLQEQRRAFTLIELLVVIAIIALLVSILLPSLNRAKELAKRAACGSRLHSLGRGVHLYANSHAGMLPTFDDGTSAAATWVGRLYNEDPPSNTVYGNTRGWFAMVRGDYTDLAVFRCPSDAEVTETDYPIESSAYADGELWDFMPEAGVSPISYGLQVTKTWNSGADGVTISLEEPGGLAIASDRNGLNRWKNLTVNGADVERDPDVAFAVPDMNSPNHKRDGQNVLYLDSSVSFAKTSLCGVDDDNIFTEAIVGDDLGKESLYPHVQSTSDSVLMP